MGITARIDTSQLDLWVEQRGEGPDVLLIAGLGDPVEAWQFQLDGLSDCYRLAAFDNRGAGRSPLPDGPFSVASMADDAARVLRALELPAAHVAGFSGGSVIAQELALRHPDLVSSLVLVSTWGRPDAYWHSIVNSVRWMAESAPSERAFLQAFFVWIYTRRAHLDGTVGQIIEESLEFPHKATPEAIRRTLDAFATHETADRLHNVAVPTLVLAGGKDVMTPPPYGREVADLIPTPGSRYCPTRRISPSRRCRTSSTQGSTPSGVRSSLWPEGRKWADATNASRVFAPDLSSDGPVATRVQRHPAGG